MYNKHDTNDLELPSTKQLIKSTLGAILVALVLLVTVILPAEYGVDPTGAGNVLGLTQMGEIKSQLALEANQEEALQTSSIEPNVKSQTSIIEPVNETETSVSTERAALDIQPTETRSIELKPGQAAEIKLGMNKDAVVVYDWSVNKGHVNFDTHGDNKNVDYFGYHKGRKVTQDKGELKASFDGKHGWFWRNRSSKTVTVTLTVTGDFSGVFRVL